MSQNTHITHPAPAPEDSGLGVAGWGGSEGWGWNASLRRVGLRTQPRNPGSLRSGTKLRRVRGASGPVHLVLPSPGIHHRYRLYTTGRTIGPAHGHITWSYRPPDFISDVGSNNKKVGAKLWECIESPPPPSRSDVTGYIICLQC